MKATDLALARAAQRNGQQQQREIRTMDLGEGWGLLGFEVHPVKSQDGTRIAAMLFAVGTKQSLIASTQMTIVKAAVAPLAEVDPEKLRAAFEGVSNPQPKESETA